MGRCLPLWPIQVTLALWFLTKGAIASGIPSHGNWKILPQVGRDVGGPRPGSCPRQGQAGGCTRWLCTAMRGTVCYSGTQTLSQGGIIPLCFSSSQPCLLGEQSHLCFLKERQPHWKQEFVVWACACNYVPGGWQAPAAIAGSHGEGSHHAFIFIPNDRKFGNLGETCETASLQGLNRW